MLSIILAAIVSLAVPAQAPARDSETSYAVTLTSGPIHYGRVADEKANPVVLEYDVGPKKGQKEYIPSSRIASIDRESRTAREERIKNEEAKWKADLNKKGMTMIKEGLVRPTVEVQYAARAAEMVKQHEADRTARSTSAGGVESSASAADAPVQESFLKRRGGQILLALLGLGLTAVIVKTLLL